MTLAAAGAASASAAPQPAIAVAGVAAVGLSVVVAPAPRYAVTVTNVGDAAATASGDDPSSIAIEGASAGAVVSGGRPGMHPRRRRDRLRVRAEAWRSLRARRWVVNVGRRDARTMPAAGAIFSVTADFNGAETSVDVSTSAETYDTATAEADQLRSRAARRPEEDGGGGEDDSPALRIRRRVRARTVFVTVAHAKGAAGRLTVTATQDSARGPARSPARRRDARR